MTGRTRRKEDLQNEACHAFVVGSQLKSQKVPSEIGGEIPAVGSGSDADRELPYVSEEAAKSIMSSIVYPAELWMTCLECVSKKARGNLL